MLLDMATNKITFTLGTPLKGSDLVRMTIVLEARFESGNPTHRGQPRRQIQFDGFGATAGETLREVFAAAYFVPVFDEPDEEAGSIPRFLYTAIEQASTQVPLAAFRAAAKGLSDFHPLRALFTAAIDGTLDAAYDTARNLRSAP